MYIFEITGSYPYHHTYFAIPFIEDKQINMQRKDGTWE